MNSSEELPEHCRSVLPLSSAYNAEIYEEKNTEDRMERGNSLLEKISKKTKNCPPMRPVENKIWFVVKKSWREYKIDFMDENIQGKWINRRHVVMKRRDVEQNWIDRAWVRPRIILLKISLSPELR